MKKPEEPQPRPLIYWSCSYCAVIEWTSPHVKALIHHHNDSTGRPTLYCLTRHTDKPLEAAVASTT